MKMCLSKKIALVMTLMILVPIFSNQSAAVASAAATPTFMQSKVEIVGEGEAYQLEIKNKVTGSTYKWSSSNTKVAKTTSKGLITSVDKGTTTVKCKITYPSKKTKTISCNVTVTIPATEINITNAVLVNGAHVLLLGESMNFNTEIVPAKTSDKILWSIGGGDEACIRIDDNAEGIVTATKAGKVILTATAAKTATKVDADKSIINDAIIIEVVGPTATVKSAEITGSSELKVVFDSPVNMNTVIGLNNKLSANIEVMLRKDIKGVLAKDPGTLTASLSTDLKTLTITSVNMFEGEYSINFNDKILTTSGVVLVPYTKLLSYTDNFAPSIASTDLDDTGMIATIRFTEPVDLTDFKVSNAMVLPLTATADPTTLSTLNNKLNYVASVDKKSVTINLSRIATSDYGKLFSVTFSGIKDMSGNVPTSFTIPVHLNTDITQRPQARPLYANRTAYNTVTVTFDRAIQFAGFAYVNSGASISGVVDANDNKKVNYTISSTEALLNGSVKVQVGYWNSYNVMLSDDYSRTMREFFVDFTADKTSPTLITYEFDVPTSILTLTYNEDVSLSQTTGIFSSSLTTVTDDIKSGTNITFTKIQYTENNKVIKLKMTNMTLAGNYTFTLDQGFALDNFRNMSLSRQISISNATETSAEFPGPYLVEQSSINLSEIYLYFAKKIDVASAETVSNYHIAGVTILSARVSNNTSESGATVVLTVAEGSIIVTVAGRPLVITGLRGYNGSYTPITSLTKLIDLKDNLKPFYIDPPVFDTTSKNVIRLNFSEQITGTLTVKVYQNFGGAWNEIPVSAVTITGTSAYINLTYIPANNTYLRVDVVSNNIKDTSGNASVAMAPTMGVLATYTN
ncbi:MAG: hypothetical protein ACYDEX_08635 [Mobilitalea sp.]